MTTDDTPTPTLPGPRGSTRRRVLLAALVLVAVAASSAASAALSEPPPVEMEQQLRDEIDAMVASGVPADNPKVEMLEDALDRLEQGAGEPARPEPGVDTGRVLADARSAEAAEDARARAAAGDPAATVPDHLPWESGTVLCEPVPHLLSADEITGATCLSVPQPDGTGRYVAVGPDGTVRTVQFGHDGDVRRLDDTALAAPPAPGTEMSPTARGELRVEPPGRAPETVPVP